MSTRSSKTLPAEVRGIVEYGLTHYHAYKAELQDMLDRIVKSPTPTYSLAPGGHDPESRPTESMALKRSLQPAYQMMTLMTDAIDRVLRDSDDTTRRLLLMCYIDRRVTVCAAAPAVGVSERQAYYTIHRALTDIAQRAGFLKI